MKPAVKVMILEDNGQKFFGEGPYRLLKSVEETGSLRQAAMNMEMAYTKARKLLQNAETGFGVKLLIPSIGGAHGGGSILSPDGAALLKKYEEYRRRSREINAKIYEEIFGE